MFVRQIRQKLPDNPFFFVMFLLGLCALLASLSLWLRMPQPRFASAAAIPLLGSALWSFSAALLSFRRQNNPKKDPNVIPCRKRLGAFLAATAFYALLLALQAPFYAATALFLFAGMSLLSGKLSARNAAISAGTMLLILLVFGRVFGIPF